MGIISKQLMAADPSKSLFLMRVYYNHNHSETGLQFVKTYYSIDTADERAKPEGRPLKTFNGIIYMGKMCHNLAMEGKIWYALICNNQKKDDTGRPLVLLHWEPNPKPPMNFKTEPQLSPVLVGYGTY